MLLNIIQDVANDIGLPQPATVINNADRGVIQLLTFANQQGKELCRDYSWPILHKLCTFTTTGSSLQGTLANLTGGDYLRECQGTFWNASNTVPVGGPSTPAQWRQDVVRNVTGPYPNYRLMQDPSSRQESLYLIPSPSAGQTLSFEYMSNGWVVKSDYSSSYNAYQADTDLTLFDEQLMKYGITWRWLKRKGLDYTEELAMYKTLLNTLLGQQGGSRPIRMGATLSQPALIGSQNIPDGNFDQ